LRALVGSWQRHQARWRAAACNFCKTTDELHSAYRLVLLAMQLAVSCLLLFLKVSCDVAGDDKAHLSIVRRRLFKLSSLFAMDAFAGGL
jgi:hypothetical protein